jgi:hypothetical protein
VFLIIVVKNPRCFWFLKGARQRNGFRSVEERKERIVNEKLLQGAVRKEQSAGRKANNTIGAMRKAPCAMRLPPGRRRQKLAALEFFF